jgi:hypothetical protein
MGLREMAGKVGWEGGGKGVEEGNQDNRGEGAVHEEKVLPAAVS